MGASLRSTEVAAQYEVHKKSGAMDNRCVLCDRNPRTTFTHWKIVENHFPYDLIAQVHHMLLPLRHVQERELTTDERTELISIKQNMLSDYDFILESTVHLKTIPSHFHLHLIVCRELPD